LKRFVLLVAAISTLLALPAVLIPASASQIAAKLGLSAAETAPPDDVKSFPVIGGVGIAWSPPASGATPTGYEVEQLNGGGSWIGHSGDLGPTVTHWVDQNVKAGTTTQYRVVASYADGSTSASNPLTTTRPASDPAPGSLDVLMIDANRGDAPTWLNDEVAMPVTVGPIAAGGRVLTAGTIKVKLPAVIAGPGTYTLGSTEFATTQGERSCAPGKTTLTVTELAYTPDLDIATMAASFQSFECSGAANGLDGAIRVSSTRTYSAATVTPAATDLGQVRVGTTSEPKVITVKNTGTEALELDAPELDPQATWAIAANTCGATVAVGESCTVSVSYAPSQTGRSTNRLILGTSTLSGWKTVALAATGTSLPYPLSSIAVTPTFTGLTVSWPNLDTAGGTRVLGYFLYTHIGGKESARWISRPLAARVVLSYSNPVPGSEYSVSIVNELGEGPAGPRRTAGSATDQIAVLVPRTSGASTTLHAADRLGDVVELPGESGSQSSKVDVTTSPDGRSLAYTAVQAAPVAGFEHTLSTRRVSPTEFGPEQQLWSSQYPLVRPSWSLDGTRIAVVRFEPDGGATVPCVYVIDAGGGTPQRVACRVDGPSWLPDSRSLAVTDSRRELSTLSAVEALPGGARLRDFDQIPTSLVVKAVSPDGRFIAYGSGSFVHLQGIDHNVHQASADLGGAVRSVSWRPDGQALLILTEGGRLLTVSVAYDGDLRTRSPIEIWAHSQATAAVWQGLNVMIGSTPQVMGPKASLPLDTSALPAGTALSCSSGVSECGSPIVGTFASGDHQVQVWSKTPSGRVAVATRSFRVDATGPVAQVTAPGYGATTADAAIVRFAATDPAGLASYDVRYRRAPTFAGYGGYVQPWTGITTTTVNLGMDPGYEYCVSARAKDRLGNVGAWSAERCFSRPVDDSWMTLATPGWSRARWSAMYLGTATNTTTYGASITRGVQGKRFYLLATRCPGCGLVSVFLNDRYLTGINLSATTTQRQVLIPLPVQSTTFTGTLKITSRSSGKLIQVDGLAVRRN
jgi:hypothetical protein